MKRYLVIAIILVAIFLGWYSLQTGETEEQYIDRILTERAEKETYFSSASDSPFNDIEFKGLSYFDPDQKYRIYAKLIPIEEKRMVNMVTNDDKVKRYREWSIAEFELDNTLNQLTIYEEATGPFKGKLFLPFADGTSAVSTYGGGRYLDVKKPGTGTIELDFNLAYNPYCAYAEGFSCPLPPPSNLLDVEINAGEKTYE